MLTCSQTLKMINVFYNMLINAEGTTYGNTISVASAKSWLLFAANWTISGLSSACIEKSDSRQKTQS